MGGNSIELGVLQAAQQIEADMVLLAHTNEAEFRAFMGDQRNEALRDRLITISVPYNLRVSDEKLIYEKLLHGSSRRFHVDPHALTAAALSILRRYPLHSRCSAP